MSDNLASLSSRKGLEQSLFEAITEAKGDTIKLKSIARQYRVGNASLYGAASAYDFIQSENAGKRAYVCNGSSCLCAGTQSRLLDSLKQHLDDSQIGHVTCLGRCHENSAFQFDGHNYSGTDGDNLSSLLDKPKTSQEQYSVRSLLERPVLTQAIGDVATYYDLLIEQAKQGKNALLQQVIDSGLRGRGGAGFPTGLKWQSCAQQISEQKFIVCNADEGDPGAFSDRYLLEQRPHAVLFGMWVAGYLTGARHGVVYIRDEYPQSVSEMEKAILVFASLNLSQSLKFDFQFKVVRGAGAYICGEETALLRSIEGQRPMVSVRPPFPTVKGLFGQPTVVNNVETFAAIHWILQHSAQAFAALGNGRSTGSKLISLDSSFNQPGIVEVAMATPLAKVVELAGGFSRSLKALHIGGPLGGLVPVSKINGLTLDFESFAEQGFLLGHAGIIGIPQEQNMAEYIHHLFEFTAAESCGKCFPCRLGATRGQEMWRDAIAGKIKLNRELVDDLLETMEKGSLCALGGGVPLPVKNALHYFSAELETLFDPAHSAIKIKEVR